MHLILMPLQGDENDSNWTKHWSSFQPIKESFGYLFENWMEGRDKFQSAYYSYLSTKKGMRMYVEHQFSSLMWGLESFHRKKYPRKINARFTDKIQRIVESISISSLCSKDKSWAKQKIQDSNEIPLSERLKDLILEMELSFSESAVVKFSEECALYRNGIFHFGENHPRNAGVSYENYFMKLIALNEILSLFYHSLLLKEIGLPIEKIKQMIFHGFHSGMYKEWFVSAGLLDNSLNVTE